MDRRPDAAPRSLPLSPNQCCWPALEFPPLLGKGRVSFPSPLGEARVSFPPPLAGEGQGGGFSLKVSHILHRDLDGDLHWLDPAGVDDRDLAVPPTEKADGLRQRALGRRQSDALPLYFPSPLSRWAHACAPPASH